jgi:hypothetical protein
MGVIFIVASYVILQEVSLLMVAIFWAYCLLWISVVCIGMLQWEREMRNCVLYWSLLFTPATSVWILKCLLTHLKSFFCQKGVSFPVSLPVTTQWIWWCTRENITLNSQMDTSDPTHLIYRPLSVLSTHMWHSQKLNFKIGKYWEFHFGDNNHLTVGNIQNKEVSKNGNHFGLHNIELSVMGYVIFYVI